MQLSWSQEHLLFQLRRGLVTKRITHLMKLRNSSHARLVICMLTQQAKLKVSQHLLSTIRNLNSLPSNKNQGEWRISLTRQRLVKIWAAPKSLTQQRSSNSGTRMPRWTFKLSFRRELLREWENLIMSLVVATNLSCKQIQFWVKRNLQSKWNSISRYLPRVKPSWRTISSHTLKWNSNYLNFRNQ